ncbi:MAG: PTS sugar transporter subunit IIA [Verrucomicrobia bacterium]|nr:PTS sugar transporter subunit IIA [Verrucomicrobiota bacterium]
MQLSVREAAALMNVSEKTIYRWIKQRKLPAFRINEQYRFSRAEILEWATAHRVNVSTEIFREPEHQRIPMGGLADAIQAGGIHYRVGGGDKESVLRSAVAIMRLPEEVDREFLLDVLVARESLGSTAIGDGVAIPHVRNPVVLHIPCPMIALCFLENAIDFQALDGKLVHTVFVIVSPTITAHLNLLSRLAFALRQPEFTDVITRPASREEIIASAQHIDRLIASRNANTAGDGGDRK